MDGRPQAWPRTEWKDYNAAGDRGLGAASPATRTLKQNKKESRWWNFYVLQLAVHSLPSAQSHTPRYTGTAVPLPEHASNFCLLWWCHFSMTEVQLFLYWLYKNGQKCLHCPVFFCKCAICTIWATNLSKYCCITLAQVPVLTNNSSTMTAEKRFCIY